MHRSLRFTKPFYDRFTPAISARPTSGCRERGRPTSHGRSTSSPYAGGEGAGRGQGTGDGRARADGSDDVGDIAIVLHSHMPYVEGFGTYPFGEEWLFDAVIRSHLPVLARARDVTVTVTPVLADQLEARGRGRAAARFTREFRVGSAELDAADVEPDLVAACHG